MSPIKRKKIKILRWEDFNFCINGITNACAGKPLSGVYGFPRGGICLAVALSHSLNIPYLDSLKPSCLVVDDVYETGKTLKKVLNVPDTTCFVWFSKVIPEWWHAIELSNPDEWLVFPWENKMHADADMKAYQVSRSKSQ